MAPAQSNLIISLSFLNESILILNQSASQPVSYSFVCFESDLSVASNSISIFVYCLGLAWLGLAWLMFGDGETENERETNTRRNKDMANN